LSEEARSEVARSEEAGSDSDLLGDVHDHPFRKVGDDLIHQGFVISVTNAKFEGPDGVIMDRDVVHHPGAVTVVPVLADGTVVMVRQFRSSIEEMLLELPAGKRDVADEPPAVTAARELREEVGLEATELIPLVELLHSPGFCDEVNHIFLATGLTGVERSVDGPEEEHMTIVHLPLADLYDRIADGTLTDAKTIVGLTLAYHRLIG